MNGQQLLSFEKGVPLEQYIGVDYYLYIKALHLIFVITYFAGLFYMPRLMVYLVEAADRPQAESDIIIPQLQLMMRRLWQIITVPSAILGLYWRGRSRYRPPTGRFRDRVVSPESRCGLLRALRDVLAFGSSDLNNQRGPR